MKTFSMTHIGRRREMNQDYLFTSETAVGNLPSLFLVADGMGGHAAGDYASRFTVETMTEHIRQSEQREPVAVLREAVLFANGLLAEAACADCDKMGMGTTIVAAVIADERLYTANVGDSRLYVISEEGITQITRDHSLVEEMIRLGEMRPEQAKNHPDRNIITRAVGVMPEVAVDFFETRLVPGDYVLLCTDGLTNMIEDAVIREIVLGREEIAGKVKKLVETANENGGRDNITVVLIEPFSEDLNR